MNHQLMGMNIEGTEPLDTVTEDMSMSIQLDKRNMSSNGKRTNEHSANTMMSPRSAMKHQKVNSDSS
jgi:hypothetical protein